MKSASLNRQISAGQFFPAFLKDGPFSFLARDENLVLYHSNGRTATMAQFSEDPTVMALQTNQHVLVVHRFTAHTVQQAQQIGTVRARGIFAVSSGQGKIPDWINLIK